MSKDCKKTIKKRKDRLQSAKHWLSTYQGKRVVRGYKKRFKVNTICAVKELELLGYKFKSGYKESVIYAEEKRIEKLRLEKERKKRLSDNIIDSDSDDWFFYIAGYTNGGIPFGCQIFLKMSCNKF